MSDVSDIEEIFDEFDIQDPFNRNRGLDWVNNARLVQEFVDQLPMGARLSARRLLALAAHDQWYGHYAGWVVYGYNGKLLSMCRWREGGVSGEHGFELGLARAPVDRNYPIVGSWASIDVGVRVPEGDNIFVVNTAENSSGFVTLDNFRMHHQLPVELPTGEEAVALDLTTDDAIFRPVLFMSI